MSLDDDVELRPADKATLTAYASYIEQVRTLRPDKLDELAKRYTLATRGRRGRPTLRAAQYATDLAYDSGRIVTGDDPDDPGVVAGVTPDIGRTIDYLVGLADGAALVVGMAVLVRDLLDPGDYTLLTEWWEETGGPLPAEATPTGPPAPEHAPWPTPAPPPPPPAPAVQPADQRPPSPTSARPMPPIQMQWSPDPRLSEHGTGQTPRVQPRPPAQPTPARRAPVTPARPTPARRVPVTPPQPVAQTTPAPATRERPRTAPPPSPRLVNRRTITYRLLGLVPIPAAFTVLAALFCSLSSIGAGDTARAKVLAVAAALAAAAAGAAVAVRRYLHIRIRRGI